MAVNSVGIGITISIKGNFEGRLRSLERGLNTATNANKNLEKSFEKTRKAALNQAIAFGVLTIHLRKVASMGSTVFRATTNAFGGMIKGAADFQQAALTLKVFFGDKSETLVGNLQALSATSGVAVDDLITITSRLGQTGMSAEMAAKATELVSQAFQTLPAQEKARAINSMGIAFQNTNSFNRAFNVSLTETEQAAFNAASGTQRMEIGMKALETRFGNVNAIMSGSFIKQMSILSALFKTLNNLVVLPALDPLTKALRVVNTKFNEMFKVGSAGEKTIKGLQDIMKSFLSPLTNVVQTIGKLNLIPRALEFLSNHQDMVKAAGAITLLGSAFAALAGSLGVATFALLSFKGVWRTNDLGGAIGSIGKSLKGQLLSKSLLGKSIGANGKSIFSGLGKMMASGGLKTMFSGMAGSMGGIVSSLGTLFANLSLVTFAAITLGIVFKEIFSGLKGPVINFFRGVSELAKGLFEVFTTGRVHTSILKNIESHGLRPIFDIVLTVGSRVLAFFSGMTDGVSGLGDVFQHVFVDVIAPAFDELSISLRKAFDNFGLMEKGGKSGAYVIGVVFGEAIKYLTTLLIEFMVAISPVVVVVKFIIGMLEGFAAIIQYLVSGFFKLAEGGVRLAEILKVKEIGGVRTQDISDGLRDTSKYYTMKAHQNVYDANKNSLGVGPGGQMTTAQINSYIMMGDGEVSRVVASSKAREDIKFNKTLGN